MGNLREELKIKARELGITEVGFVSAEVWDTKDREEGDFSPKDVWPSANGVIVLGIPVYPVEALPFADEFGYWDVRNGILDTAAYRLALYLNKLGYPSVNIPTDSSGTQSVDKHTVPVFSHRQAGAFAGLIPAEDKDSLLLASVLTSFTFL